MTVVGGGLSGALAACGSSDDDGGGGGGKTAAPAKADAGAKVGGPLNVLGGYAVETMAAIPAMKSFIDSNGLKIKVTTPPDDGDTIAKLAAGGTGDYNMVGWISQFRNGWTSADVLGAMDLEQIPNAKNLIANFGGDKNADAGKDPDGNTVGIPVGWNVLGIAYDGGVWSQGINSYEELLDPKYKGKITMLDEPGAVMSIGCQSLGFDMSTITKDQLKQVQDLLTKFIKQTRTLSKGDADSFTLMAGGDVSVCLPGTALTVAQVAKRGKKTIRVNAFPKEGGVSWMDMYGIPKDPDNVQNTYAFLNEYLTLPVAKPFADAFGELSSVEGAQDSVPKWYKEAIPVDNLDKAFDGAPGTFFPPQKPEGDDKANFQEFIGAWQQAKVAAGRA